jgi:hypothetical protein
MRIEDVLIALAQIAATFAGFGGGSWRLSVPAQSATYLSLLGFDSGIYS